MPLSRLIFTGERASPTDIEGINLARYKFALKYCKGKSVLELGCAFGYGTFFLVENGVKKIVAYDANGNAIKFARQNFAHSKIEYKIANVEDLQERRKFGTVVALELIEHLKRPDVLLLLVKSVLEKGGVFIISTPNRLKSSYDGDKPTNPYHFKEYFPDELNELLKNYFGKVELYGIFLKKEKRTTEKRIQRTLRWRLASVVARKRWVRKIINYFPEQPKRLFTGESKLSFKTEDFVFSKNNTERSQYLIAVCRK